MADGKIIASAMPESFERSRLDTLARVATQSLNALEFSRQHVTDVDLIFDQHRLVIKNLRGGVLAILCARTVNLPLLNMTANNAVKKLAAELNLRSGVIPASAMTPPAPPPATTMAPAPTSVPTPSPDTIRVVEVEPNELYIELEKESQRLVSAANSAQLRLCVMDPIALWARTTYARDRVMQPQKRQLDFLALSDQANLVSRVFDRVGYQANQRFNSMNATRFLNFNETARQISVIVFLNSYDMYHRIDLSNVLAQNESIMTETGLALMRLQDVEITVQGLDELCALFLEHELSTGDEKEKIDAAQITRLCADDWGWYRTVTLNLDRLQAFAPRELSPSEETRVVDRIRRLKQSIESAPKSFRWQTRARLGDGVRWYETPQVLRTTGTRPDLAMG
jgi:predicted regulator of Ras-like GTPase activity (Roadblock/LC7/MglB family)